MNLKNSTILITGGTSGIGLELAKQLTAQGATILITGRDEAKLQEAKRMLPQLHIYKSDVSDANQIEQLYRQVTTEFPGLNILINNAGIMRNLNLQDTSMDLINITSEIETNLSGTIRMVHQFLPHLKSQNASAIVNISSGLAFMPFPPSPIYSAAKSGVHAYTQVLRLQLKKTSVKVFELAPPATQTALGDAFADLDLEGSGPIMNVQTLAGHAIKGILKDNFEIIPGMSKALKLMGRIAPGFFLNLFDRTIEKGRLKMQKLPN